MSFEYWFMFPIAIVVAIIANASGFSGGVLFQPIYNIFLHVPIQNSVATGVATETVGMTSGVIRYLYYRMVDLPIGFTLLMLTIPGIVLGSHALTIIPGDLLKFVLGFIIIFLATVQLVNAVQKAFGTKDSIPVEDIYPYMAVPPLGGFFSATTGTGICEMMQPLLEKGLGLKTKKANATAIMVEAIGDWIITILNIQAGFIMWEIWIFSGTGVIIGGQIGPWLSRYLPERLLKIVFSLCVITVGVFYIIKGIEWMSGKSIIEGTFMDV
jgi:uncharacterized membrane protein YfcA